MAEVDEPLAKAMAVLREALKDDGPLVREHATCALPPGVVDGRRP